MATSRESPRLTWTAGSEPRSLILGPAEAHYCVGRISACEVRLEDPEVSRHHAELLYDHHGWIVADRNSKNGTFLDGRRLVRPKPLPPEARIRCGQTVLAFADPSRGATLSSAEVTETAGDAPLLTPHDREVLELLCRPLRDVDDPRSAPVRAPSNAELADILHLSEQAVRKRLKVLYRRLGVPESLSGREKRRELIAVAFERGAVTRDAL